MVFIKRAEINLQIGLNFQEDVAFHGTLLSMYFDEIR